jgi:hypothetical protein
MLNTFNPRVFLSAKPIADVVRIVQHVISVTLLDKAVQMNITAQLAVLSILFYFYRFKEVSELSCGSPTSFTIRLPIR